MREKCCAIVAGDIMSFPWGWDDEDENCEALKLVLLRCISKVQMEGISRFLVNIDPGFGLYAAEMLSGLVQENNSISFDCYISHEELSAKWPPAVRDRYFEVLQRCETVITTSNHCEIGCETETVLTVIDDADVVIAICPKSNGWDSVLITAVKYASHTDKDLRYVRL